MRCDCKGKKCFGELTVLMVRIDNKFALSMICDFKEFFASGSVVELLDGKGRWRKITKLVRGSKQPVLRLPSRLPDWPLFLTAGHQIDELGIKTASEIHGVEPAGKQWTCAFTVEGADFIMAGPHKTKVSREGKQCSKMKEPARAR